MLVRNDDLRDDEKMVLGVWRSEIHKSLPST
jgi:hypothetical protein